MRDFCLETGAQEGTFDVGVGGQGNARGQEGKSPGSRLRSGEPSMRMLRGEVYKPASLRRFEVVLVSSIVSVWWLVFEKACARIRNVRGKSCIWVGSDGCRQIAMAADEPEPAWIRAKRLPATFRQKVVESGKKVMEGHGPKWEGRS
jgi:hypothetical protein